MKKWFAVLLVVVAIALAGIYIFIPSNLTIRTVTNVNCTSTGAYRFISDYSKWQKWWPDAHISPSKASLPVTNHAFSYGNATYTMSSKLYNGIEIQIKDKDSAYNSKMMIVHLSLDSTAVYWQCNLTSSINPLKRIQQYRAAVSIKNNMGVILDSLHSFLNNRDNIYGIQIQRTTTMDTFLIASRSTFTAYPSTEEIYSLINTLRKYIIANSARETAGPIINITKLSNTEFELMAAVPTNKELKNDGNIFFRKMIPGNFMAAEVKGGYYTVAEALDQLQLYMSDYQKTKMAIPFELLITDRTKETDTAKWITRIYQPAFK